MADVHGGETRNQIRDGTVWGPVLQGRDFGNVDIDVTIQAVAPAPVALDQLPAPLPVFTGREPEVAALTALLDPTGTAKAVVVSAVAGLAGVGKTQCHLANFDQAAMPGLCRLTSVIVGALSWRVPLSAGFLTR